MKHFSILIALVFLASCGSEVPDTPSVESQTPNIVQEATVEATTEIDAEVEALPEAPSESDTMPAETTTDNQTSEEITPDSQTDEEIDSNTSNPEQIEVMEEQPETSLETNIDADIDLGEDTVENDVSMESKVLELQTTYNNPKMEVVMDIEYSVDSEGNITEISVTSPNYSGMSEFNTKVQAVVGMSVSEASEYYVAGSSLTTPAFQAALKNG